VLDTITANLKAKSYQKERDRFTTVTLASLSNILYPPLGEHLTKQDKMLAAEMVARVYSVLGFDKDDRDKVRKINFNILNVEDVVLDWDKEKPIEEYGLNGKATNVDIEEVLKEVNLAEA